MITIQNWTGLHTASLRQSMRMSIREFAQKAGVSERTVSKWEERLDEVELRPINQATFDELLTRADTDTKNRFMINLATNGTGIEIHDDADDEEQTLKYHAGDGKAMAEVPSGVFLSGEHNAPLWLAGFYIDIYPVTNSEYANFVAATGYHPPEHWINTNPPQEIANHPVVHVNFHDATAYATWAGKMLPNANQWEKAAGGASGYRFPWGKQATHRKCNTRESDIGYTTPVNCYHSGTSPYGAYDMAGNVWEWCASESEPGRYILKGSAFTSPFIMAENHAVNDAAAKMSDDDTGFRCITTD